MRQFPIIFVFRTVLELLFAKNLIPRVINILKFATQSTFIPFETYTNWICLRYIVPLANTFVTKMFWLWKAFFFPKHTLVLQHITYKLIVLIMHIIAGPPENLTTTEGKRRYRKLSPVYCHPIVVQIFEAKTCRLA